MVMQILEVYKINSHIILRLKLSIKVAKSLTAF